MTGRCIIKMFNWHSKKNQRIISAAIIIIIIVAMVATMLLPALEGVI